MTVFILPLVALAYAALLVLGTVRSDDRVCLRQLPVNVVLPDGALARNLHTTQFVTKIKAETQQVVSVKSDHAPRRVVFVVDTAKENSDAVRKIEAEIISAILAKSEGQDSFALLTAHGARREVRFGESRDVLLNSIQAIAQPPRGKNELSGVLDAVHAALGWLQPTQPGDAIVVVADKIEGHVGIGFAKIRDELSNAGVRLFGFQIGTPLLGYVNTKLERQPSGGITVQSDIAANTESLDALTAASGGFTLLENTDSDRKVYKLTDERLDLIKRRAAQFYKAIEEFYIVSAKLPAKGYSIDVIDSVRARLPGAMVLYPARVAVCQDEGVPPNGR